MQLEEILRMLGLTVHESTIYLSLLQKGVSGISKISRETGINRPAIYKIVPILIDRGLVTEVVKKKQKHYSAESPEKLELLLDDTRKKFSAVLPELMREFEGFEKRPTAKFLTGKKGITFIFEDVVRILKKGDIFYRYSSPSDVGKADKYLPESYRKIRDEKQLERLVITGEKTSAQKEKSLERSIKVIPKLEEEDFNVTQVIYANKIAFINYESEIAVLIEDRLIANFQKMLFRSLYARL